ncbi:MAG: pirin family protein [Myxococcales bacterium]|nr:pirin family protein [Myxococcales bacterium]
MACMSSSDAIAQVLIATRHDLGGFEVGRVLPSAARRMVGPFIFFDHMGPGDFAAGQGIDVRPHPHIGLATVTYLYEGSIFHRDSLGFAQSIEPGAINWMTAGRGIVHSERTAPEARMAARRLHGLQLWLALPLAHEQTAPAFVHYPASALPELEVLGAKVRVLAGHAFGATSPVKTLSPLFYVDAALPSGGALKVPANYTERAAYVAIGRVRCGETIYDAGTMLVFAAGETPTLHAEGGAARIALVGGEPLEGPRLIWWNFVASNAALMDAAKAAWAAQARDAFPPVPGETEFIPLPTK